MWILTLISIGLAIAGVVGLARKGVPESICGAVWAKAEKLRWIWSWWIACVAFSLLGEAISAIFVNKNSHFMHICLRAVTGLVLALILGLVI